MKNSPSTKLKSHGASILKFILPMIGCLGLLGLTSCGTIHGVGHDVETAGETIKHAAH